MNRRCVQRLMRTMGLNSLYPGPNTSWARHAHKVLPVPKTRTPCLSATYKFRRLRKIEGLLASLLAFSALLRCSNSLPTLSRSIHERSCLACPRFYSIDFIVIPTVRFTILYVLVFLSIGWRRVVHFNVTEHPTAAWTAQKVVEAFPWNTAPRYLLRDGDGVYGNWFRERVKNMGIEEVLTSPYSP